MLQFSKPEIRDYIQIDTTKCTNALAEGKLRTREHVSGNYIYDPDSMVGPIIAMGDCRCPCPCECKCTCTCLCECPCRCECKCTAPCESCSY